MAAPTSTTSTPPARPWLVADIGGTNARFGWMPEGADVAIHVRTSPTAAHTSPADAARVYLADLHDQLGSAYRPPQAAAWAVATAVAGNEVRFTNNNWCFSRTTAQAQLGLRDLLVINDFEALALALPHLQASQVRYFGGPITGIAGAALAVIGPGTGLGVAGLVPSRQGWVAVPGEGGHASLAAVDDFEAALLAAVRKQYAHVSAERLLSGIGLPVLHAAVAQVMGLAEPGAQPLTARQIVEAALQRSDPVCEQTVNSFCALLGSFAGNVALTLGARGGVYIGGGVVPHLGDLFYASAFRQRFEDKGRFKPYLQAIPTILVTDTLAALTGAAAALQAHRA